MTSPRTPWCIAHRGARQEAPENTWSAFKKALTYPIDGIELDVQMSADGVPFLYHDDTLWRITRQRKRVANMTFAELARLDWGAWYDQAFKGEPLMTLEELLKKADQCPRWLIEIKSSLRDHKSGHARQLAHKVASLILKTDNIAINKRLMILSFDPHALAEAYHLMPDLKYVLNLTGKESIKTMETLPITPDQLWAIDVNIGRPSTPLIQWARKQKLKIFTYTCNGPRQLKRATEMKVDGIISDRPGWLTKRIKGNLY